MSTSAPGAPGALVSPANHLHLAPAYAAVPQSASSSSSPAPPTAKATPLAPSPALRPFTPDELKRLVLEYLCSCCYVDSARAFARELAASSAAGEGGGPGAEVSGPSTNGTSAVAAGRVAEAMEGIEATPEPSAHPDIGSAGTSGMSKSSIDDGRIAPPLVNGKTVAFDDGVLDGVDEDDGEIAAGSLLSKEDLRDVRRRQGETKFLLVLLRIVVLPPLLAAIRQSILAGRITHAVDLLNEHFPSVLSPSSAPTSASGFASPSKLPPSHPLSPKQASCSPRTFFVPPSSRSSSPSPSPTGKPLIGAHFGPWAQSLSPEIVSLNLQTQVFIELMRTAYATSAHSTPSTPTPSVNGGDAHSDADMSASTSSVGSFSILNVAIAQAQALAEKVSRLPLGREREGWEKERVDVSALLAYKSIESCEVRGYFEEGRKEALAEMVNAAILQHTNRTPLPLLSLAARQATSFWSTLREMNVAFPPAPSAGGSTRDRDGRKPPKTYPAFDLRSFLRERETAPASTAATRADDAMEE
ncbi:hypothetical protein Rhopal_001656-T1 [Rhodotorula paludigena]|uniref:CRA domain-containing protein n=1 Tax=Rhodotorula paludigena TaxID=86838 RepID=A0AAV5GG09_9BASI|nr:hypothetical protein Rhopal_001656-T1 [Rhodotorula paludigena]